MNDLHDQIARALYDAMEGPLNNQDFMRQTRQWELCRDTLAPAVMKVIKRRAAAKGGGE